LGTCTNKNDKSLNICLDQRITGYKNSFKEIEHCGKLIKYTVNTRDSNCYYNAYGNKVLYKNIKKEQLVQLKELMDVVLFFFFFYGKKHQ